MSNKGYFVDSIGRVRKPQKPKASHPLRATWSDKMSKHPAQAKAKLGWVDRMGLRF